MGHQPALAGGGRALAPAARDRLPGHWPDHIPAERHVLRSRQAEDQRVQELPFTSATAEFNALESGSVDYGYVPATDIAAFGSLKSNGFSIEPWYEWGITFIQLNTSNPSTWPLESQLYIRQAMQYLINQPAYIKAILGGLRDPDLQSCPDSSR